MSKGRIPPYVQPWKIPYELARPLPRDTPLLVGPSVRLTGRHLLMPPLIPLLTTIMVVASAAMAAILVGVVIALVASRKAPDGYEDQSGFHSGRR